MKKWEQAVEEFLENLEFKDKLVGAIICGSYITGRPTKQSDIDIHLILEKGTKWRERGNIWVNGFQIEYFANTSKMHEEYFKDDWKNSERSDAHMFSTGRILFDKTGEISKLVKLSNKWLKRKFEKSKGYELDYSKYALFNLLENLEKAYDQKEDDFYFIYFQFLNKLVEYYSRFLGFPIIQSFKLRRFLTDNKDRKKYKVPNFPDKLFVKLLLKCFKIQKRKKMMKNYKEITKHLMKKMKIQTLDGWKSRATF